MWRMALKGLKFFSLLGSNQDITGSSHEENLLAVDLPNSDSDKSLRDYFGGSSDDYEPNVAELDTSDIDDFLASRIAIPTFVPLDLDLPGLSHEHRSEDDYANINVNSPNYTITRTI